MTQTPLALGLGAALLGASLLAPSASAQTPLTTELVVDGFNRPTWVGAAPGETIDRLFVLEQNTSLIRVVRGASILPTPFLSLAGLTSTGGERGLLGMAFHPDYQSNGYFFVNYTAAGNGASVVARYRVSAGNPDMADPTSAQIVLTFTQPFSNHNGGDIAFGPDGFLYIPTGDGGSANDPACRAQNPAQLLGKMLRIDVDAIDGTGSYAVPPTNPFVGQAGTLPEIYHLGLRNPWRFSFDSQTGIVYIGDVGQNAREEVSVQPAGVGGLNYGWKIMEGEICGGTGNCPPGTPPCGSPVYTMPIHTYVNTIFNAPCAITGGYVYRGCAIPDLRGTYFFADYCSNAIWSFRWDGTSLTEFTVRTAELNPGPGLNIRSVNSFGLDRRGELLIVDHLDGEIFRVVPNGVAPVACNDLRANQGTLPIADGGTQFLHLEAGSAKAGAPYLLLGSASGTAPGLPIDSQVLPLNLDFYLLFSLNFAGLPPFINSLGLLDSNGRASMKVQYPGGLFGPTLVGLTLHHAALSLAGSGAVDYTSNAVALTLTP